jgi:menaquinone-dependent protoporphyrinogen oxidase
MSSMLVTYSTRHGSTAEVAQAIAEELRGSGVTVDVRPLAEVAGVHAYDAVLVGGPMIIGWHRQAVRFLVKNEPALGNKPVALFLTAKALTGMGQETLGETPVFLDPGLAKPPKNPTKLTFREKEATVGHYLHPVFKKVPTIKPVAAAFFGGKIDYSTLNPLEWLFVKVIIRADGGDSRDWEIIRAWAREVLPLLGVSTGQ